jgi:hypothetical protein
LRQRFCRPIRRAIVNDNDLEILSALRQHRFDRLTDYGPAVIGWDYDAD